MRRSRFCAAVALFTVSAVLANDSQILEVYDNSLTTVQFSLSSTVQDVLPQHFHRGTHIDGSIKEEPLFAWAVAGNPWAEEWNSKTHLGSVRLDVGAYSTTGVDMALPAEGFSWVVGRTYNSQQENSNGHRSSDSYQGWNWFQTSQPEIVVIDDDGNDELTDMIYLIYGADRFLEFKRATDGENPSTDTFRGVNGAAGAIKITEGSPDLYVYHDQNGMEVTFFGGNTASGQADWQMWKMEDPAGNVAYIGSTTATTAVTTGYDSGTGAIKLAYDTEGRKYTYSYSTFGSSSLNRLTEVKAEAGTTLIQKVVYDYYDDSQDCSTAGPQHGEEGDLKSVTVTTPLSQANTDLVETSYYRYWRDETYDNDDDSQDDCDYNPGDAHLLKMVIGPEGVRKYDSSDATFDDDQESASDADLKPYSDAYFTYYDSSFEIETAVFDGECGCTGGVNGTHTFTYDTNPTFLSNDTAAYDTDGNDHAYWAYRTVIDPPNFIDDDYQVNEAWTTQYFDEVGQPLSSLRSKVDPATDEPTNTYWFTHVYRNTIGCITEIGSASHTNVSGSGDYDHNNGGNPDGSFTLDDDDDTGNYGLVYQFTRTSSGDYTGFATNQAYTDWYITGAPEYLLWSRAFYVDGTNSYHKKTVGDFDVVSPLLGDHSVYATFETSVGANSQKTEYDYSFHEALVIETITIDEPDVSTGYAPTTAQWKEWYGEDGDLLWSKDPIGTITYHEHTDGQQGRIVEDANTITLSGEGVTIPSGLSSSGTLHRETEWDYDDQGRITDTTLASGRVATSYYTTLADRRAVVLEVPRVVTSGSTTYYGPADYAVYNLVGEVEASATIAVTSGSTTTGLDSWIDETKSDVIQAYSTSSGGALARLTTWDHSDNGRKVTEEYSFHEIPASIGAAVHTEYELTKYEYNHMGLVDNVTDPTGTQAFRKYTSHGQMFSQGLRAEARGGGSPPGNTIYWVSSGGHGGASHNTYHPGQGGGDDGGGSGGESGEPTEWECFAIVAPPGSDHSLTTIHRTPRNQVRYVTAAGGPDLLYKYDNLGRVVAVGVYDITVDHGLDTDWTTASPISSTYEDGRMFLIEAFYDARGNRYKITKHEIDPADGSDDDSLDILTWTDGLGRQVKQDAEQLTKQSYDALGRMTREYVLAKDNDTGYSDAEDVAGDIVLEDSLWAYDLMDNVLLASRVDRYHDSGISLTGPLDESDEIGGDGDPLKVTAADLNGRAQVTTYWHDDLDRLTDTGEYGTNSGSDLDRDGLSVPTRPTSGVLLVSYAYDDAGRQSEMTDPLGAETQWTYDDAGRTTEIIRNYVDGDAGGGTLDDEDLTTAFEYWEGTAVYGTGQLRKIIAKQNETSSDNEVTEYFYGIISSSYGGEFGTSLSAPFTAGHVLVKASYPDSTDSDTDVVWYGYDNQALLLTDILDQDGSQQTIWYDQAKREVDRDFAFGGSSNLDKRIIGIARDYDALGRLMTVTQRDSSDDTDEVRFTYDGWGNLELFEQDLNSAINTDAFDVSYVYAKHTAGRNTVLRTELVYPDSSGSGTRKVLYKQGDNLDVSRLISYYAGRTDQIKMEVDSVAVKITKYDFLGANRVVGTKHAFTGGNVHSYQYGSTSGSYPDLDQFNRVTTSRWSKVRSSGSPLDWYQETISYNNNSNITRTEHGFFDALDALFTIDGLDRITDVEVGDYAGGSVSNDRLGEVWELTQLGNWSHHKLNFNDDTDYTDPGEFDDKRTFNLANELTDRDLETDGLDDDYDEYQYDLVYDDLGNLTDDGEYYKFKYDIRGQLVEVTDQSDNDVAKFRYNGLGYLISKQFDVDDDGTLEDEEWRHFVYDEQWRVIAVYRGTDEDSAEDDPKERYVYHAAGQDGVGSYIDDLILRDRDAVQPSGTPSNTDPTKTWEFAGDGTLEERVFFCQNWRADVVLVLDDDGDIAQRAWYTPYGVPTGCDPADLNADGVTNTQDITKFLGWHAASDPRADWNLDGTINTQDTIAYLGAKAAAQTFGGRGVLSSAELDVRHGYAGYRWDEQLDKYHVRNRVYDPYSGRWINRDPIEYEAGTMNLYEFTAAAPVRFVDPMGLAWYFPKGWWRDTKDGAKGVRDYWLDPTPGATIPGYSQALIGGSACTLTGVGLVASKGKCGKPIEFCCLAWGAYHVGGGSTGYSRIDQGLNSAAIGAASALFCAGLIPDSKYKPLLWELN